MRPSLLCLALLTATVLSAFAAPVDLGINANATPYDPYMEPVKSVLDAVGKKRASMERAADLVRVGRSFRYVHSTPYNPALPTETAARRAGDCKDKALWLCDQLRDPSARFVIGTIKRQPEVSHAWVMWENAGRWWILDCTMSSRPIPADRVSKGDYVPLYSYGKNATYRHSRTASLAANGPSVTAAVAATGSGR